MGKLSGKNKQRYVASIGYRSKSTCVIRIPGHYSEQCEVLNEFGKDHALGRPFKELRQELTAEKSKRKSKI